MAQRLTRCSRCQWKYPDELLHTQTTHLGTTHNVCGICALVVSNELMSEKRDKFDGPKAEELRQAAITWRQLSSGCNPKNPIS